ncbi:MAG: hypothetical protein PVH00_11285, partial [Gemmatimonadota bacterium]
MSDDRSEAKNGARSPSRRLTALTEVEAEHAEGFSFHGPRILLLLILAVATYLLFPAGAAQDIAGYELGSVPPEDLIAEVSFEVPKSPSDLRSEQNAAANAVAPVFRYDSAAVDTMRRRIDARLDAIDAAFAPGLPEAESQERLDSVLTDIGLPTRPDIQAMLRSPENRVILRRALDATIATDVTDGVVRSSQLSVTNRWVLLRKGTDARVPRDSMTTESELWERASRHLPAQAPTGMNEVLRLLIIGQFEPTIYFDQAATDAERTAARNTV